MRPCWDSYFMGIAFAVSRRATCDRLHVGCVLVHRATRTILATGFNGAVRGLDHCDDVGHDLVESKNDDGVLRPNCVRVVHAESNAVAQAARNGARTDGAMAYVTALPCWPCARLMLNAGIGEIVYASNYRPDERVVKACAKNSVGFRHLRFTDPVHGLEARISDMERMVEGGEQCIDTWRRRALEAEASLRRLYSYGEP